MVRRRRVTTRKQGGIAAIEFIIVSMVLIILSINIWILLRPNDDDFENSVRTDLLQIVSAVNVYRASNNDAYPPSIDSLGQDIPHKDPHGVPYRLMYTESTARLERTSGTEPMFKSYKHAIVKCTSLRKDRDQIHDVSEYAKDYRGSLVLGGFLEGFVTWVRDADDWEHNIPQQ